jgi:hypothetical protein
VDPLAGKQQAHDVIAAAATEGARTCVGDCPQASVGCNSGLVEGRCSVTVAVGKMSCKLLQSANVVIPNRLAVERLSILWAPAAQAHKAAVPGLNLHQRGNHSPLAQVYSLAPAIAANGVVYVGRELLNSGD